MEWYFDICQIFLNMFMDQDPNRFEHGFSNIIKMLKIEKTNYITIFLTGLDPDLSFS